MSNYRRGSRTSSSILIATALFSQHANAGIIPQSFRGLRSIATVAELAAPITGPPCQSTSDCAGTSFPACGIDFGTPFCVDPLALKSTDYVHNQVRGFGVTLPGVTVSVATTTVAIILPTTTATTTTVVPAVTVPAVTVPTTIPTTTVAVPEVTIPVEIPTTTVAVPEVTIPVEIPTTTEVIIPTETVTTIATMPEVTATSAITATMPEVTVPAEVPTTTAEVVLPTET
ncbi:unnamed protein product, partial [Tilletia laevis]